MSVGADDADLTWDSCQAPETPTLEMPAGLEISSSSTSTYRGREGSGFYCGQLLDLEDEVGPPYGVFDKEPYGSESMRGAAS
jgi:hypothetical protein